MRQRVLDFILRRALSDGLKSGQQNKSDSEHSIPLLEIHLDRAVRVGDPVAFVWEIGILKYENTSDGNCSAAKRCLSKLTPRSSLEEYLRPRLRIDLHGDLERDGTRCRRIRFYSVCDDRAEIPMPVFKRLTADRQLQCRRR